MLILFEALRLNVLFLVVIILDRNTHHHVFSTNLFEFNSIGVLNSADADISIMIYSTKIIALPYVSKSEFYMLSSLIISYLE